MICKAIAFITLILAIAATYFATIDFTLGHAFYSACEAMIAMALWIGFCLALEIASERQ